MSWTEGLSPGEPSSARASGTAEDDGVLLSVALDLASTARPCLCRRRPFAGAGPGRGPHAIPFHFHGNYFASPPLKA